MKRLFLFGLLLTAVLAQAQYTVPFRTGAIAASGGSCTPVVPSVAHAWQSYNASNVCVGGCTGTGNAITSYADSIGSVTLNGTGHAPTFTSSAVNSQPAATFNGTSSALAASSTAFNYTAITAYAVIKINSLPGSGASIFASDTNSWQWRMSGTGHQEAVHQSVVVEAASTSVYSTGVYYAIAFTWNAATGNLTFYKCSSGTCSTDGVFTGKTASFSSPLEFWVGATAVPNQFWPGDLVDFGVIGSESTSVITQFGTYAQCKYGI